MESSMPWWGLLPDSSIPTFYVIFAKPLSISVLQYPHLERDKNTSEGILHMTFGDFTEIIVILNSKVLRTGPVIY